MLGIIWKLRGKIAGYHADVPSHLGPDSRDYINANVMFRLAAEFGEKDFAARTLNAVPFSMYVTRQDTAGGRDGHFHLFSLLDVKGESTLERNPEDEYWEHLRRTQGILFVVGASSRTEEWFNESANRSYSVIVDNFISQMKHVPHGQRYKTCQQQILICLTQVDQIVKPDNAATFGVRQAVESRIGRTSLELLEKTFPNRVDIVATSAVGWTRDEKGIWQANATGDRILQRERQPYNAVYALFRLLDHIEDRNIRKHRWFPLSQYTLARRRKNVDLLRRWKDDNRLPYMP
ncbi:MAG: hypothetical protein IAE83_17790 [Anaerolinea sp.]|nr:hypothetical protein [Anaerolinea sp.]